MTEKNGPGRETKRTSHQPCDDITTANGERLKEARVRLETLDADSILRSLWLPLVEMVEKTCRLSVLPHQVLILGSTTFNGTDDLQRFDGFLTRIREAASTQGVQDEWSKCFGTLKNPAYKRRYRQVVSTSLEVIVLGALLAEWGDECVRLWPRLPNTEKRSDAQVHCPPLALNCEVTCMWSERDLRSCSQGTGIQVGARGRADEVLSHKFTEALSEKSSQFHPKMLNIVCIAPLFLSVSSDPIAELVRRQKRRMAVLVFDGALRLNSSPPLLPGGHSEQDATDVGVLRNVIERHWPSRATLSEPERRQT